MYEPIIHSFVGADEVGPNDDRTHTCSLRACIPRSETTRLGDSVMRGRETVRLCRMENSATRVATARSFATIKLERGGGGSFVCPILATSSSKTAWCVVNASTARR